MACAHCGEPLVGEIRSRVRGGDAPGRTKVLCSRCAHQHRLKQRWLRDVKAGLRARGERCDICHVETLRLQLDHDHSTGAFRGWLCETCNLGLGQFRDDPTLLARAIEYLAAPSSEDGPPGDGKTPFAQKTLRGIK